MKHSILFFALINLSLSINASGPESFDTSFNSTGYVSSVFTGNTTTYGNAIALQEDSKIIIAGTSGSDSFIARYNTDGSIDTTFNSIGTPGYIISTIMSATKSLVIQPDGKIIVTGTPASGGHTVMIRYLTDGTVDTSFGLGGSVTTSTMTESNGIGLQSDGKIIITGTNGSSGITMRYTINGTLDTSFGSSGSITTIMDTDTSALALQIQTDDSIVIAGFSLIEVFVARYSSQGAIDTSFGTSGYFFTNFNNNGGLAYGLALQDDEKIIVVGSTNNDQGFIMRLNTDGTLDDTSFAAPTGYTFNAEAYSQAAMQLNQQIVVAGYKGGPLMRIVRYNSDGTIDSSCNLTLSSSLGDTQANSMALQRDQKIIAAGFVLKDGENDNKDQLFIARFLGGFTPTSQMSIINAYGYNATFLSEFLYVDFYAQTITDATARTAAVDAVTTIINSYITTYANQTSFNYILYTYLMNEYLLTQEEELITAYPDSAVDIARFFTYIFERIALLTIS